jgi:hypothetical protein
VGDPEAEPQRRGPRVNDGVQGQLELERKLSRAWLTGNTMMSRTARAVKGLAHGEYDGVQGQLELELSNLLKMERTFILEWFVWANACGHLVSEGRGDVPSAQLLIARY